jgi:hypothetical protein
MSGAAERIVDKRLKKKKERESAEGGK